MKLTNLLSSSTHHFKLVVLGGGTGGLCVGSHFSKTLPQGSVAIIEPKKTHYYQPGFTLVGSGLGKLSSFMRDEKSLIPKNVKWIQENAEELIPSKNLIQISNGDKVSYDYLIVATGCQTRYDLIEGLEESLNNDTNVVSIYLPHFAEKTFKKMEQFKGGKALFTFPNTPVKCAGAPQKICYLFEDYQRRNKKRGNTDVIYNTTLPKIFGVDKYAKALMKHVDERGIILNTRRNLVKVDPLNNKATFEQLNDDGTLSGKFVEEEFTYLHVGAPCSPQDVMIRSAKNDDGFVDKNGWLNVDKFTLQNVKYPNVFGIGDATNTPNAKTAAAISSQFRILKENVINAMNGKKVDNQYTGYGSCPLLISYDKGILAEFDYNGPVETMPIDQSIPSYLNFAMKVHLMPALYWNGLVKGFWEGPCTIRKLLHLGLC
ncbi:Pyridine nucleotide-disulphide oxidoreductase, FAD/NAD(P)-binding domain-containing protein [Strongyloides ratti]|uniref:Sulfide:quinone oxidoreductase, mitochondrial n=1 Tax=Strongyloides ratti TaxID=34506 RepID=A0A090L6Y8_STRRB|nr:Pyridine nucleotide-disulphide oxidoreductase, FAD/NAD(P)-binding domain-containing protein [Strongyloides ratti]CEF65507.1 Pyridine nucleotide-disulphide oxidoreductase, FAD/NAD(P)-binding domain-containing protein [Strongyloides ratti]